MIALLLLLQAAPAAGVAAGSERFSILVDPCASARDESGKDIVVCGRADAVSPRLPMRDLRGPPDHAVPSNPDLDAAVALNGPADRGTCGGYGENCPIGGGGLVVPALVNGVVTAAKSAFAKHPDKRGRVAIDLDSPPPAGTLAP